MQYQDAINLLNSFLTLKMYIVPFGLVVIGFIVKPIPGVQSWMIPLILLGCGIAFGLIFQDYWEAPLHLVPQVIAGGFLQGLVATGVSQLYYQVFKQLFLRGKQNDNQAS